MTTKASPDFIITDEGSLQGRKPQSEPAQLWFDDNVETEGWQWMGAVCWVDHRLAYQLVEGIVEAGFDVGGI